jgi:hypothetical protein
VVVTPVIQNGDAKDGPKPTLDGPAPKADANLSAAKPDALYITMVSVLSSLGPFGLGPLRAAGVDTTRAETRVLDKSEYATVEPLLGHIKGWWWIDTLGNVLEEGLDSWLTEGYSAEQDKDVLVIRVGMRPFDESDPKKAWTAEHVWGFETFPDGLRRYTGRIWVAKGKDKAGSRQVYDFVS